jgi:CBS domain-containing protein
VKLNDSVERIVKAKTKGLQVHSVAPDASVYEALIKMADEDIGALLVIDGATLVGMFSERDYARKVALKDRSSREMKVHEIMTTEIVTASPQTTVDECMCCMTANRCRHIPVMDGGAVVGLVSIGDLVHWIISAQDGVIHQLEDYICGKYPG